MKSGHVAYWRALGLDARGCRVMSAFNRTCPVGGAAPLSGEIVAKQEKVSPRTGQRLINRLIEGGHLKPAGLVGASTRLYSPVLREPQDVVCDTNRTRSGVVRTPHDTLSPPSKESLTSTTDVVLAPAPTVRGDNAAGQQLVSDYADACTELGVVAGARVKGRVGKEAARLIHDGHTYEHLRVAVRELARRNASPALLELIVGDVERVANGVPIGRAIAAAVTENPVDARLRAIREGRA